LTVQLSVLATLAPITVEAAVQPRAVPELPGFYQRILTLPEAQLYEEPSATSVVRQARVPTFSVLYVYDCQPTDCTGWLQVGAKDDRIDGWIAAAHAQDWRSMLVMQYASRGRRDRVVMFKDEGALSALVAANDGAAKARSMIDQIEAGHTDPSIVAAVEPKEAVNPHDSFYLMPILSFREANFADDTPTRLLQIASVNREQTRAVAPPVSTQPAAPKFRIGIVFVLETSNSMGPYLDRTKQIIRETYRALEAAGTADRVSIGLVGYRTDAEHIKGMEYTTRIFQPLDPNAKPNEILSRLDNIREAQAYSKGWREDGIAGLYTAMNELDWTPYAARIVVAIADSGLIGGNSPLAHNPGIDVPNIVELADRKKISIFPVYLMTREGDRWGGRGHDRDQWQTLGRTGDQKYIGIHTGAISLFGAVLDSFSKTLVDKVGSVAANRPIERPSAPPSPANDEDSATGIARSLVNELFRAQAEYLGTVAGTPAPTFFRAWVSDRDLVDPMLAALQVRVFLTRNQLNDLGASLSDIVNEAKRGSLSPRTFFDNLQRLSATMSGDPSRRGPTGPFSRIEDSNLLPAYLKALPYRSKVLRMTQQMWLELGLSGQQEFIDELEYKLRNYRDIEQDNTSWVDLGGSDRGSDVYPISLDVLP
jgi:serine/threonine-protein kinase PpkA